MHSKSNSCSCIDKIYVKIVIALTILPNVGGFRLTGNGGNPNGGNAEDAKLLPAVP